MATGDKKTVVMQADRAIPYGVATLDESGVLDSLQWPDIDNFGAADRVLSNLTDPALALSNIGAASNPNLLDNWYFADPIDQRGGYVAPIGVTFYNDTDCTNIDIVNSAIRPAYYVNDTYGYVKTGTSLQNTKYIKFSDMVRGYVGTGYGIDRWTKGNTSAYTVEDDGVHLKAMGGNDYFVFCQFFEQDALPPGTYTLSLLVKDLSGTMRLHARGLNDDGTHNALKTQDFTADGVCVATFTSTRPLYEVVFVPRESDCTATLIAAKLELGSVQTLAHQDANGNWVLNDPPPNKQQELAKCQRYQVNFASIYSGENNVWLATGVAVSTTMARFTIELPEELRATPSVSFSNLYICAPGASFAQYLVSKITNVWPPVGNKTTIQVTVSEEAFTRGQTLILNAYGVSNLLLDANL